MELENVLFPILYLDSFSLVGSFVVLTPLVQIVYDIRPHFSLVSNLHQISLLLHPFLFPIPYLLMNIRQGLFYKVIGSP